MKLFFYTTLGCHLCEQAAQIIGELQQEAYPELYVETVDIADDDELIEKYGVRIPVVRREDKDDLGWPFDKLALKQYLE